MEKETQVIERLSISAGLREPFNALSHLLGAVTAPAGLVALLYLSPGGPVWTISLAVYGASLFLLFAASAGYHAVNGGPKTVAVLRKLDHSAIYLLIAGTYTPICANAFSGFWQWGLLAVIWALAFAGIGVKLFVIDAPRWVVAGVYVVMGWLSVFAIGEMLAVLPLPVMLWLLAGGIIYTAGAAVYVTKRLDFFPGVLGFHEVWHIFVLLGAAAHFVAVLRLAQWSTAGVI